MRLRPILLCVALTVLPLTTSAFEPRIETLAEGLEHPASVAAQLVARPTTRPGGKIPHAWLVDAAFARRVGPWIRPSPAQPVGSVGRHDLS